MRARASKRRAEFVLIVVVVIFVIIGVLLALFLRVRAGRRAESSTAGDRTKSTREAAAR